MTRRLMFTLVIALLLAVASLLAVRRLRIDTSLASLFDRDDPAAGALLRVMDHFRSVEELLILVESESTEPDKLLAFAQRLDDAIKADADASQLSDGVIYRVDPEQRRFFEEVLVPNGLFYLDDAAFESAGQRLTRDEMLAQLKRDETLMSAPGPGAGALSKVLLKDPLRLHEFLISRVAAGRPFQTYQNSDAFLSADGKALLIRVRGRRPVSDIEFAKRFSAAIRAVADRANTDRLGLDYSGAYAIAAASERAIRSDMIAGIVFSVVSLQLLFILVYRRPLRSFLFAFTPVIVGILYGFGAYATLSRGLTPMTAVIGGILAGIGIDYAAAFLAYYQSHRSAGLSAPDAASATRRRLGAAVVAAWATSVAGFFAIGFSRVSALRDFAILGSLGLTGAFLCAMFLLPALLAWANRGEAISYRFRVDKSLQWLSRHLKPVFAVTAAALLACVAILVLPGSILPLESDLSVMHPRPNPPLEAQTRIAQHMGTSPGTFIIHFSAKDADELLRLAHQVESRLRTPSVQQAGITGTFGLATLLPDPAVALARIKATGPEVADRVIADFRAAAGQSIFEPAAFEPYTQFLRKLLTATHSPDISDLERYPSLAETILPKSSQPTESITLVFLRQASEDRQSRDAAIDAIRSVLAGLPGITLTGLSVLNHDTELAVRRDLPRLVFAAVAVAMLYLILQFRSATDCLLAMLPAIFGLVCLLAFMRLAGQKLNMINLIAFPLLVGIDVDYGIFLVMAVRRRELGGLTPEQVIDRLAPAASAVLLCAAAALLGFGSLAFTSIPAVQSLGLAVGVGIISCVIGTFFLSLPILLLLSRRKDAA